MRASVIVISPRAQARLGDRPPRSVVMGLRLLEEVQYVFRAIGRPHREKAMIDILQRPAAPHGDKPGISLLREDDLPIHPRSSSRTPFAQRLAPRRPNPNLPVSQAEHSG